MTALALTNSRAVAVLAMLCALIVFLFGIGQIWILAFYPRNSTPVVFSAACMAFGIFWFLVAITSLRTIGAKLRLVRFDSAPLPRVKPNRVAFVGFAFGTVGAWLSFIPLSGPEVCWLPALLALILGLIGLGRARKLTGTRRPVAVWAIVLGLAPIVIATVIGVIAINAPALRIDSNF